MFICPLCDHASLGIKSAIELPADLGSGDELTLQVVRCGRCSFRGAAIYEESRHGSLTSESRQHDCFAAPVNALTELERLIASCPRRSKARCSCAAHLAIGRRDELGQWTPPVPITGAKRFAMKRSQ